MTNIPKPAIDAIIEKIVELHYDLAWTQNVKNTTNIEEFEKWCLITAQSHAAITLKFMFDEEDFKNGEDTIHPITTNLDLQ